MKIPYIAEVIVYGMKNEAGIESKLACQVFLSEEKLQEMGIGNGEEQVKKDIAELCNELVVYKRVTHVVVRDKEFEKTTTNKIKRDKIDTSL